MTSDSYALLATAASVGFLHTLFGPDHYVPFAAMARSNGWTWRRTTVVTLLCGIGHILGSVLIGLIGLALGAMIFQIEAIESMRGEAAAWLLIGFGLAYLSWGLVRAVRNVPHCHVHVHADGTVHAHPHRHDREHQHVHCPEDFEAECDGRGRGVTPWILFIIFAFGPCEVLIPLLMYPAAEANAWAVVAVVVTFGAATLGTMLAAVAVLLCGLNRIRIPDLHRYSHALAGLAVLLCGVMVKAGW